MVTRVPGGPPGYPGTCVCRDPGTYVRFCLNRPAPGRVSSSKFYGRGATLFLGGALCLGLLVIFPLLFFARFFVSLCIQVLLVVFLFFFFFPTSFFSSVCLIALGGHDTFFILFCLFFLLFSSSSDF